jgi:AraC-like DNA-binding protein
VIEVARQLIDAVDSYVIGCFATGTAPRVDELARQLGMHPDALSRSYKSATGCHLSVVLKDAQIEEAKRLLRGTYLTLAEVARRAGFGTPNTLFRTFRVRVGMTPDQYRRSARL